MSPVFWLSMHVPYRCRDAGACCSAGWPIPVEQSRVKVVQALRGGESWLRPAPDAPPEVAGVLAVAPNGHCVFHRSGCAIQHAFGHAALPSACQHFPREVLIDRRGVFVTLSHYCPTAADLLFDYEGPVEIVAGPAVVSGSHPEGLDARDVLPPLLTSGVLMDDEGYSAWERHMVTWLTRRDALSPEDSLAALRNHATALQRWRPGSKSLAATIDQLAAAEDMDTEDRPDPFSLVIRRFLAARAFASWMAYQGDGLRAVMGSLDLTLDVLRRHIDTICMAENGPLTSARLKSAIRGTDLALVHQMPRDELARLASTYVTRMC